MEYFIYRIINKVSNKCYVGKTSNHRRRKSNHMSQLRNNTHANTQLQNAYNKHGREAFEFEIIETTDELNVDNREIFWILEYNSFKNGYNRTAGGDGNYPFQDKLKREKITPEIFAKIREACIQESLIIKEIDRIKVEIEEKSQQTLIVEAQNRLLRKQIADAQNEIIKLRIEYNVLQENM